MNTQADNHEAAKERGNSFPARLGRVLIVTISVLVLFLSSANTASADSTQYCFAYKDENGQPDKNCSVTKYGCEATQASFAKDNAQLAKEGQPHLTNISACTKFGGSAAWFGDPTALPGSDAAATAQVMAAVASKNNSGGMGSILEGTVGKLLEAIAHLIFWGASIFMAGMGLLLDFSIEKTISSNVYASLGVIKTAWTIMRDFANMFFIFILLYIAITTILGMAGHNTKTMLRNVIIAALLINFSLFITQVVVDAGNVVAVGFYDKIQTNQGGKIVKGPSTALEQGLNLQTILDPRGDGKVQPNLPASKRAMIWAGGAIVMFIAGYVFLAGAAMMIIRSITLIFLMIFSPVAFVGFLLPKTSGAAHKWWDSLISNTILAPAFVIMLYLVVLIVQSNDLIHLTDTTAGDKFGAFLGGDINSFEIMYNYFVLCGLIIASLKVAQSVSSGTAAMATGWAKKGSGMIAGVTIGAAALGGRQIIGKAGQIVSENKKLQERAQTSGAARMLVNISDKAAKSSFDLRGSKVGGAVLGGTIGAAGISAGKAGGEGGFKKTGSVWNTATLGRRGFAGTENEAAAVKRAKELFPDNAEAQDQYVRDHVGTKMEKSTQNINGQDRTVYTPTSRLDTPALKKEKDELKKDRERLEREKKVEAAKKTITEHDKKMAGMDAVQRKTYLDTVTAAGEKIGDELTKAINKLNGKEFAAMNEQLLSNPAILERANAQHLAGMKAKADEYKDETLLSNTTKVVLDRGTESGKRYMKSQAKTGDSPFTYDYSSDIKSQIERYDAAKAAGEVQEQATAENEIKTIIGRIDPKDVAALKEVQLQHEAVVGSYKRAHVAAIHKRQLEDRSFDAQFIKDLHTNVSTNSTDTGTKDFMHNAQMDKKSQFFDADFVQTQLVVAQTELTRAQNKLATTPIANRGVAQAEVDKWDKEVKKLKAALP